MNSSDLNHLVKTFTSPQEIIGKEKYFNSAVLVPLIEINDEYHLLFEIRSGNIRQGGEVSFPGGEFDPAKDKNLKNTAIRETSEELGIFESDIEVCGKMGTLVAPMGVTVDPFVGILKTASTEKLKIDLTEVEKVFTIPVDHFIKNKPDEYFVRLEVHPFYLKENGDREELLPVEKLGLPKKYSSPWKNGKHRVLVYKTEEAVIWGITAEIVYEFCRILSKKV
jgi:8-oxo-dGTP pyrophosphatase MutT (NUDIX family)